MTQVVVIGAGAAGAAALACLHAAGCGALALEARDRVGGRIWTLHPAGWPAPVELGAEFVHSELDGLQLVAPPPEGRDWTRIADKLVPAGEFAGGSDAVFERMAAATGPDRSFATFLDQQCQDLPARARTGALAFIEGYEAANPARISVVSLQREFARGTGPQASRPCGGYDQWFAGLLASDRLRLGEPVRRVSWRAGAVEVVTPNASVRARAAIITLPLAVLQSGTVEFDPPLTAKREALAGLVMGNARRVVLRLRQRFWDQLHDGQGAALTGLRFLFGREGAVPVWWTDARAPQITGWAGGRHADALAGLDAATVSSRAVAALAAQLGVPAASIERELIEAHTHDWQTDPFARGAYSYAAVGSAEAHAALAEPLAGTLFFAGEATDASGRHATVPGAIASGRRAAEEALTVLSRP